MSGIITLEVSVGLQMARNVQQNNYLIGYNATLDMIHAITQC